ncbi:RNA-directed DNA methylation 4 [Artemisia annua]|uniref:RNA-directed DNA methylation 4 n=1 Tax=Artemisia annua TaxID=35608 RepID=A0A2U1NTI0_ARTAN|nr:RNA-directed DNA methylation 4 [Artemisia annua]
MAAEAATSSSLPSPSAALPNNNDDKPVIVRVKRKSYQSPLEAFWLEVNERPVKRPLLDFHKLSINDSPSKVEELKSKKFFVQHVETVSSSDVAVDIIQSFVTSKPDSTDALETKTKNEDQRRSNKTDNKQKKLLGKAKETQELLAKNARFKQIWKSRNENDTHASDYALRDMYHFYDVERVDAGETSGVQEQEDEDDQRLMYSFLPLLQEFIPSAAEEFETEMDHQIVKQASKDDYVYDLYAVKDGNVSMMEENSSSPFPFVQVDDDDNFYNGPDNSDYDTDDSNAEDNPMNDYPDEEEEEEEENMSAEIAEIAETAESAEIAESANIAKDSRECTRFQNSINIAANVKGSKMETTTKDLKIYVAAIKSKRQRYFLHLLVEDASVAQKIKDNDE